jgi:hypothetical protein
MWSPKVSWCTPPPLTTMLLLVSTPCATSDNGHYGAHGHARLDTARACWFVREGRCCKKPWQSIDRHGGIHRRAVALQPV